MTDPEGFDIATLRAKVEKATPDNWGWVAADTDDILVAYEPGTDQATNVVLRVPSGTVRSEDAEFISVSRSALPWCLDHIKELEASVERLCFEVGQWQHDCIIAQQQRAQERDVWQAPLRAAESEVAALRAALERYGQHDLECLAGGYDNAECTCDFEHARVLLRDQEAPTDD